MLLAILAAMAVASSSDAATSPTEPAPAAQTQAADASAKSDVVCHTEQVTGSRFPKKVCRSRAEMEAQKQDDQDALRNMQRMTGPRGN